MVSRKNFQQNGRTANAMQQRMQRGAPYKKPFKLQDGNRGGQNPQINQIMFTASQMPDNPGYMDFSINPIPPTSGTNNGPPPPPQNATNANAQQKKRNNKNRQKNKQMQSQQYNQQQMQHQEQQQQQQQLAGPQRNGRNGNWNKNKNQQGVGGNNNHNNNRFNRGGNRMNSRNVGYYNDMMPMSGGPINNGGRGRRLMPPRNMRGIPPMPPNMRGIPPMPPNMRGIPPMPPMHCFQSPIMGRGPPHGMAPMLPPRGGMHRGGPPLPSMQFNGAGRPKKPNTKIVKKVVKGKSTIKTLKTIANQYPLDKPWVTEAIRAEHETKVDIENRLKGNKDDELFAQFKTQRDKFVALYEAAREEYLKNEAAAVKTKDAKDKQTNNKTATKDANNKEEISKNA